MHLQLQTLGRSTLETSDFINEQGNENKIEESLTRSSQPRNFVEWWLQKENILVSEASS